MGDPIGLIRLHLRPRMFQECFAAGQKWFRGRVAASMGRRRAGQRAWRDGIDRFATPRSP